MSIWFHDLIYEPTRKDNEEKSAHRAMEILSNYVPSQILTSLNYMILSTAKHSPMLSLHDNKIFLDFDLLILATDDTTYQNYTTAIRKEYQIFPDELYRDGRKSILNKFLNKKRIYFTDFFYQNFEERARDNIEKELEKLS